MKILTMQEFLDNIMKIYTKKELVIDLIINTQHTTYINSGNILSIIYRNNGKQKIKAGPGCIMGGDSFMIVLDYSGKEPKIQIL